MTPTPIILDCDPGHDDAIAILLALASPEVELVGVTTVSGNQTLDKTTANALRVLELAGRGDIPVYAGADAPFMRKRDVAAHVHGESGLDGPDLPRPTRAVQPQHAVEYLAEQFRGATKPTLVATGPLTNVGLALRDAPRRAPRADRADGRLDRRRQPHAGRRVQHLGRPRGRAARLRRGARHDDGRPRRHAPRADHGRAHRADAKRRQGREGRRRADGLLRALPQDAVPGSQRLADARSRLHRAPDRPDADGRARRVHRGRLHDRPELGPHERRLARPRALRRAEREGRARHRRRRGSPSSIVERISSLG